MNYWIGCAYDAAAYKTVVDSLNKKVLNLNSVIKNDSIAAYGAIDVIRAKDETIKSSGQLSDKYEKDLISETKRKKFWRGSTLITGVVAAIVIILQTIKP